MYKMGKLRKKTRQRLLVFIMIGILIIGSGVTYFFLRKDRSESKPNDNGEENRVVDDPIVKKVSVIDLDSKTRPYAVMINNNSAVWKYQSGMNEAYIVYEMLVEGGITREMALYKDASTAKIASVRSSRHYFLDYALENDAIYVHWGWSPKAQSDISTLGINNINGLTYEGSYFFRDSTVKAGYEHRGYTKMESLNKATEKLKYRSTTDQGSLLAYSVDPIDLGSMEGAVGAKYVEVPYSSGFTAKFFYDEETKMYKRSQNKTDLIDYTSKERITTKNLIVYSVSYSTMDNYGRLDMKNVGSGTGYYISEGKAVPITWEKSSRASRTKYKYKNGDELVVNDGRTYIGLQPNGKVPNMNASLPV